MPWAIVAAAAIGAVASAQRAELSKVEPEPMPEPEPTECDSCGAPLRMYAMQCDYCRRVKEPSMWNWLRRRSSKVAEPVPQTRAEQVQQSIQKLRMQSMSSPSRSFYSSPAPSPAPAPSSSGFDPLNAALWYSVGSSSHASSHSETPVCKPETPSYSSGGGGDYGGGGASSSWESSSSSSSSDYGSSSSYDSSSSSSSGSDW